MLKFKTRAAREAEQEALRHEAARADARRYLAETDWMVVRAAEPDGKPVSADVLKRRKEARVVLNG